MPSSFDLQAANDFLDPLGLTDSAGTQASADEGTLEDELAPEDGAGGPQWWSVESVASRAFSTVMEARGLPKSYLAGVELRVDETKAVLLIDGREAAKLEQQGFEWAVSAVVGTRNSRTESKRPSPAGLCEAVVRGARSLDILVARAEVASSGPAGLWRDADKTFNERSPQLASANAFAEALERALVQGWLERKVCDLGAQAVLNTQSVANDPSCPARTLTGLTGDAPAVHYLAARAGDRIQGAGLVVAEDSEALVIALGRSRTHAVVCKDGLRQASTLSVGDWVGMDLRNPAKAFSTLSPAQVKEYHELAESGTETTTVPLEPRLVRRYDGMAEMSHKSKLLSHDGSPAQTKTLELEPASPVQARNTVLGMRMALGWKEGTEVSANPDTAALLEDRLYGASRTAMQSMTNPDSGTRHPFLTLVAAYFPETKTVEVLALNAKTAAVSSILEAQKVPDTDACFRRVASKLGMAALEAERALVKAAPAVTPKAAKAEKTATKKALELV